MTPIEVLRKKVEQNEGMAKELEKTAAKIYRSIMKEKEDYKKCREHIVNLKKENKALEKGISKLEEENK